MKRVHLLAVDGSVQDFAPLIKAAREQGLRIGWLELEEVTAPRRLTSAARAGASRAVAVGRRQTVTVKRRRAAAVIDDLLREYFRGCAAVLVVGDQRFPELRPEGRVWTVSRPGGGDRKYSTERLLAALRRPRPFGR